MMNTNTNTLREVNTMKKYRRFISQYNQHVVFVPEGKKEAVTRRLYKNGEKYSFRYNNENVVLNENQLYW